MLSEEIGMKALMSERVKEIFRGCSGTHKQGIVLAMANASAAHKKEFEFHCALCNQTFTFVFTGKAQIK